MAKSKLQAVVPPTEDTEANDFVLEDQVVHDLNHKEYKVPRVNWGKEIKILKLLKGVMASVAGSGVFREGVTNEEVTANILALVLEEAPDALGKAFAVLTELEEETVDDLFVSEEMAGLVIPFLSSKSRTIGKVLRPYLTSLANANQPS